MMRATRKSGLAFVLVLAALAPAGAEDPQQRPPASGTRPAGWVVPRTADGRPDLEGVWENNSATPLERPRQFADKPRLSDEELASLERRARTLFAPDADAVFGDALYLALLADTRPARTGRDRQLQSELAAGPLLRAQDIADRGSGRRKIAAAHRRRHQDPRRRGAGSDASADAAQDMSLQDRCIHYGFPDLFAAYMSVYRIVQTPDYVAIQMEKIHDARIIPLDGRAHLSSAMRQYLGDSRGRWEGDTLVVETTNFHPKGNPMGGYIDAVG